MKEMNLFAFLEKHSINFNEYMLVKMIVFAQTNQKEDIVNAYFRMRACCKGFTIELLKGLKDAGIILKSYKIPEKGTIFNPKEVPLSADFIQEMLNSSLSVRQIN